MESINISFKKLQRSLIETFIAGFNASQTREYWIEIEDSDTKNELKLFFFENTLPEHGRLVYGHNLNLLAYRLNDVRPSAIIEHLGHVMHDALSKAGEEKKKYDSTQSGPESQQEEEEVTYNIFYERSTVEEGPHVFGISPSRDRSDVWFQAEDEYSVKQAFKKLQQELETTFKITMK